MKAKHTPGPWAVEFNNPLSIIPYSHSLKAAHGAFKPIAIIFEGGGLEGRPEQKANAKLLAAAPDLLETLTFIKDFFENRFEPWPDNKMGKSEMSDKIKKVIAKATGERGEG